MKSTKLANGLQQTQAALNAARIIRTDPRIIAAVTDGDYSGLDDGEYAEADAAYEAAKCRFDVQKLQEVAGKFSVAIIEQWSEMPAGVRQQFTARAREFEKAVDRAILQTWTASLGGLLDSRFKRLSLTAEPCGRRSFVDESRDLIEGSCHLDAVDRIVWAYMAAQNLPVAQANRNKALGFIVLATIADPEVCRRVPGSKRKWSRDNKLDDAVLEWLMEIRISAEERHWAGCFILQSLGHPSEMLEREKLDVLRLAGQQLDRYVQWAIDTVTALCPRRPERAQSTPVPVEHRVGPMSLTKFGEIIIRDFSGTRERAAREEAHELMAKGLVRAEQKKPGGFLWYFDLRDIHEHWPHLVSEFTYTEAPAKRRKCRT